MVASQTRAAPTLKKEKNIAVAKKEKGQKVRSCWGTGGGAGDDVRFLRLLTRPNVEKGEEGRDNVQSDLGWMEQRRKEIEV